MDKPFGESFSKEWTHLCCLFSKCNKIKTNCLLRYCTPALVHALWRQKTAKQNCLIFNWGNAKRNRGCSFIHQAIVLDNIMVLKKKKKERKKERKKEKAASQVFKGVGEERNSSKCDN